MTATDAEFLNQLDSVIGQNLSNNQFGVEELAAAMNMSRSNLLRKVKKLTGLSVTQLISKVRLEKAMELLRGSSMNVTEIADAVGFGSASYFIKVFREKYGYPPGSPPKVKTNSKSRIPFIIVLATVILGVSAVFLWPRSKPKTGDLSIAVLPFKNESSDSSNVYLINGLMESTLSNLQQIPSLKVISRTTSEKYRGTNKSIPEMAKELNVNYFIEGSGQKIGDKILLNIQLIEASTDQHLWAKQYRRETSDIFELQHEIAKNIADEIEVVITPEADRAIRRKPTNNIVAYDYFLKGKELFYRSGPGDLDSSRHYFAKAVEYDSTFALAYATAAMVHYYLDMFMAVKKYGATLDSCADRAMKFDPTLSESYIAKGLAYAAKKEHKDAVSYLEKAHELDPNSGLVIHFLTEFYSIHVFNLAKYLEYSLIGVKIDRASPVDSATTSFKYFHLGNAFASSGFMDEGLMYIDRSLELNPNNAFSKYFRYYILFAKDRNIKRAREAMVNIYKKDTMRIDVIQEVAKLYVMERDYRNADKAYRKMVALQQLFHVDIYSGEGLRMLMVYDSLGDKKKAEEARKEFLDYCSTDESIYKHLTLSTWLAYNGKKEESLKEFGMFLDEDNYYHYWTMFLKYEPYMDPIKDDPRYKVLLKRLEDDFWENHREIKKLMESKGLL